MIEDVRNLEPTPEQGNDSSKKAAHAADKGNKKRFNIVTQSDVNYPNEKKLPRYLLNYSFFTIFV